MAVSCSGRGRYQCENGRCVSMDVVCNGEDNCGDASDENNHTLCHSMAPLSHCEFVCDNKRCVRDALVCNYVDDCGDGSDEQGCRKHLMRLLYAFSASYQLGLTFILGDYQSHLISFFLVKKKNCHI